MTHEKVSFAMNAPMFGPLLRFLRFSVESSMKPNKKTKFLFFAKRSKKGIEQKSSFNENIRFSFRIDCEFGKKYSKEKDYSTIDWNITKCQATMPTELDKQIQSNFWQKKS